MRYIWKVFKWESATERTELTEYLNAPVFLELRCNEQLSSGAITLDGVPLSIYPKPFAPKTKLTIERWVGEGLDRYYDYMVDRDEVEKYTGLPGVCCHRIQLIEPSVFAQGMNCDNFSLTYELNDVTLSYKTVVSSEEKAVVSASVPSAGQRPVEPGTGWSYPLTGYGQLPGGVGESWGRVVYGGNSYTAQYGNGFLYEWADLGAIRDKFNFNLNALIVNEIEFTMPVLRCRHISSGASGDILFDCPTRCTITRTTQQDERDVPGSAVIVKSQLYSPVGVQNRNDRIMYNSGGRAGLRSVSTSERREYPAAYQTTDTSYYAKVFRSGGNNGSDVVNFPAMINTNNTSNSSRVVNFETSTLTQQQLESGVSYKYEIALTIEPFQEGAQVQQYTATTNISVWFDGWWIFGQDVADFTTTINSSTPNVGQFRASTSFLCRNMLEDAPATPPFLIRGQKYNCFDLFRKAMLTCDARIFNNDTMGLDEQYDETLNDIGIQYPIEVSTEWATRMKNTIMNESVFENKNLWEVLQQIGYYLHAIPYLEFARNGKNRFILKFKQLGKSEHKNDDSNKITVFNSIALDNFFTQYDSYVTNLFSPQNEVEEWLVCKTSDSNFLVSNNTAELHTRYNITELIEFDITYGGVTKSALEFVFEKSVYDTLSSKTAFTPAKWTALYFSAGTNKVLGLNYVPPTKNNEGLMALKTIVGRLFSGGVPDASLKFNDLRFRIKYKTQDELRINQVRPDLGRFMKNSDYENYPHHEQFFNQQDKIIDSERFSANLWGRLIRVANGIYQRQEHITAGQEKEPGDLIKIDGANYYVTECENEHYPDAIFQKVTYSMNFNQLSNIVTIPSEPRFYEVSERVFIRREVRLLDFIKLSTSQDTSPPAPRYINYSKWHAFIRGLLFADGGNPQLPNFAYVNYKADKWRTHYNLPNQDTSILFPSSDTVDVLEGTTQPAQSSANREVIVPVLHFPLKNALVVEWDMDDNFKAGDSIDKTTSGDVKDEDDNLINDEAYMALQPVRYCDVYGRADLFDFKLFNKNNWTTEQSRRLPFAGGGDFAPTEAQSIVLIPSTLSVALDKDNREALSFNYQLNLLHDAHSNDAEDFITFSNLFGKKNSRLKAALLRKTVSMFDEAVDINPNTTVADDIGYSFTDLENCIRITFEPPEGIDLSEVQSIVFYDTDISVKYAYLAKNVAELTSANKLQNWWIYPVFSA